MWEVKCWGFPWCVMMWCAILCPCRFVCDCKNIFHIYFEVGAWNSHVTWRGSVFCSRTYGEQPCCSGGVVQHWTKTPKVMLEKMHRHCNAVTVSATLPSRHSVRMATDNITVGTTVVKHSIYYILGCRDTSSSGSQPLTAHHLRQALRTCAHSQAVGQVTSGGGCVVYTQKYTD